MKSALKKRSPVKQKYSQAGLAVQRLQSTGARRSGHTRTGVLRQETGRSIIRQGSSKTISTRSFKLKNKKELWFAGCLFLILLSKLFIRVSIIETSYQIERARNELLLEDAKFREIKVKRAMVANPKELSKMANSKLQLRPTIPQQIRKVKLDLK